jgi:predicted permease
MSIVAWLKRLLRRRLDDEDFQEEIRAHLALAASDRMADGADPTTARQASLKDFGNVTLTTEAARRVWTPRWIEALRDQVNDVRYAIRALRKNPAFALTVIAVLTLGIGLNAAVFTMLKSMAFSPVAGVEASARLRTVFAETGAGRPIRLSYPEYQYLRDHDQAFSGLYCSIIATVGLGRGQASRAVWSELVTGNYFEVLGVRAERGRTLLPADEVVPGRHPVVVISDGLWRRDFAADPDIVGKTFDFNNYPLTVVGVAAPSFHGTTVVYDVEAYIPVMMAPQLGFKLGSQETTPAGVFADRRVASFTPEGFLRPGVTMATAVAQTDALWPALLRDRPLNDPAQRLRVVPYWQAPNGAPSIMLPTLTVLAAMGLLVLLIACANIAGLVLVRGMSRRGEIAMRQALGATRTRIVRLLIVENLVLAAPGALLGVLLASQGIPLLAAYAEQLAAPQRVFFNIEVDSLVIGFAVVVACGSALAFGFLPALRSSRVDLVSVMNEVSPRGTVRGRLRAGLVAAQVAVSLLLLIGSGLVTRSLAAAQRTNHGFDASQVTVAPLDLRQNGYDEARGRRFYRRLLEVVRGDATTDSASLSAFLPLNILTPPSQRVAIEGYEPQRGEDLAVLSNVVGPDYLRTLRIGLLAGREFTDHDDETGAPVAVVNRTFAERFWGSPANAIGKRIRAAEGDWRTVIGVSENVKYVKVNETARPYFYLPLFQSYRPNMVLQTRSSMSDNGIADRLRAQIAALDPDLPIPSIKSLSRGLAGSLIFMRLAAMMLSIFGIAGMALAAMGTYGLVSYTVKQSTHEIGIRLALGASRRAVVRRFVGRGLQLGAIGAAVGLVVALGGARLLTSMLFGVSATDAIAYTRALIIVLGVVVAATLVPAWRAAHTDPLRALRHQ